MANNNDDNGRGPWDPGQDDDQNPWARRAGGKGSPPGDDSINEMIDKFQDRLRGMGGKRGGGNGGGGGQRPSKGLLGGIAALAVVAYFLTGFYQLDETELAVILRFGEAVRTEGPGLHYHLPFPVEHKMSKKVTSVNILQSTELNRADTEDRSLVLTGDENIVEVLYTIRWYIKDLHEYLFNTKDPDGTVRVAAESVVREVIGRTSSLDALTEKRTAIGEDVKELLQNLIDTYKLGITVEFELQEVRPPEPVIASFHDVQASVVDAERYQYEAKADERKIVLGAEAQKDKQILDAQAQKEGKISLAKGEAERFNAIYEAYKINPDVAFVRYYLDRVHRILKRVKVTLIQEEIGQNLLPHLSLKGQDALDQSSVKGRG